jgi:O-antigen/teichoic acid export membrane protein
MRDIASFGVHSAVAGLSWTAFRNADFTIVVARLGPTIGGYYWRAFQMALEYQRKVSSVMMEIAFPIYSRAGDLSEMFAIRRRMVRVAAITIYPMLAGLAVLAPSLIPWLFGPAWEPCVGPTQILTVAGMATLLTDAMGAVLFAAGRPRMLVAYNVAYFATYAGAVFVATPFGLSGVCVAVVAVYLVYTAIAYGVLLRGLVEKPLGRLWGDIAPATVSSAALVGVGLPLAWALRRAGAPVPVEAVAVGAAAGAAYLVTLQQLFPAGWSDLLLLARRILRRRPKAALGDVSIAGEALAR